MTDGVTITLTFTLKPEFLETFLTNTPAMLDDTEKQPGFRNIRIAQNRDDPNRVLIFETWDSEEAYAAYMDWRGQRGEFEAFSTMLAVAPEVNFWPQVVASKNL